jgi:hypothetical protein
LKSTATFTLTCLFFQIFAGCATGDLASRKPSDDGSYTGVQPADFRAAPLSESDEVAGPSSGNACLDQVNDKDKRSISDCLNDLEINWAKGGFGSPENDSKTIQCIYAGEMARQTRSNDVNDALKATIAYVYAQETFRLQKQNRRIQVKMILHAPLTDDEVRFVESEHLETGLEEAGINSIGVLAGLAVEQNLPEIISDWTKLGVQVSPTGIDFGKISSDTLHRFAEDPVLNAQIATMFGSDAAVGLRNLYHFTEMRADAPDPRAVMLGSTWVIPAFGQPQVMSQDRYTELVAGELRALDRNVKAVENIAKNKQGLMNGANRVVRQFIPGVSNETGADQALEHYDKTISKSNENLVNYYGLGKEQLLLIFTNQANAYTELGQAISVGIAKTDAAGKAVVGALVVAGVAAAVLVTGGAALGAVGGFSGGVVSSIGVGLTALPASTMISSAAMTYVGSVVNPLRKAAVSAWKAKNSGQGGFWCNFGQAAVVSALKGPDYFADHPLRGAADIAVSMATAGFLDKLKLGLRLKKLMKAKGVAIDADPATLNEIAGAGTGLEAGAVAEFAKRGAAWFVDTVASYSANYAGQKASKKALDNIINDPDESG